MNAIDPSIECPCSDSFLRRAAFSYDAPPKGETSFGFTSTYSRSYDRCELCGHWFSQHSMDLTSLYSGAYVDATYGDRMRETYDRVMALPPERSDNMGRVRRIAEFGKSLWPGKASPRLLDVGSGLAVFPARMREAGWDCTALDPDARASEHARNVARVSAYPGDFLAIEYAKLGRFDAITFNKVIEHVLHPVDFLRRATPLLEPDGFIYVEVPDGEAASLEGPSREEFFIEHHHVFSAVSLAAVAMRAQFEVVRLDAFHEPSGKYTLAAFLRIPRTGQP